MAGATDTPKMTPRAWNVLVVDDDADLRDLVSLTLGFDDDLCVIGTAGSADEAIRRVAETQPDLVVLDNLLGGPVTGLQVADRLHATREPAPRVILFSAADEVVDLREHHVDAVVSKLELTTLPDVARRILGTPAA